jgi:hypothetical protein
MVTKDINIFVYGFKIPDNYYDQDILKKQFNMIIFIGICSCSINIFLNVLVYQKMCRILRVVDKKYKSDESDETEEDDKTNKQ